MFAPPQALDGPAIITENRDVLAVVFKLTLSVVMRFTEPLEWAFPKLLNVALVTPIRVMHDGGRFYDFDGETPRA